MIDFRQSGHTETFEDVQDFAAVFRVVEDHVDDRASEGHVRIEMVDECVIQPLFVAYLACEGCEGAVRALVAFDERRA
jgi:hypothetical protein